MRKVTDSRTRPITTAASSLAVAVLLALVSRAHGAEPRKVAKEPAAPLQRAPLEVATDAGVVMFEPVPVPEGQNVALGEMLAFADEHSPVLRVSRTTRSRAEAARAAASPLLPANPQVSIAAGPRVGLTGTGVDLEASISQQIQIAGERGVRRDAAERFSEMTDAEIEQVRWTVHCDVHAAFHRALVERERLRLSERVVVFQQEVLRVVQRQIAAGETAPLSLRLAEAEVAQAVQAAAAARQGFIAARIRLAQLAGWPVARPPNPSGNVDPPHEPPGLELLVRTAVEKLPRLKALAATIAEAEARLKVANREIWPKPSLGVQYRHEGNPTTEGPYDIVLGALSFPIPSFDVNQGDRARARADVAVAQAELDAAKVLLNGQIAELHSEVVAAAQRTRAYGTEILPRFEENLTLLRRSFELGEIDILALSIGRERFLRIQSDALSAQLDYFVAIAGLERVVGIDLWGDDHHEEDKR